MSSSYTVRGGDTFEIISRIVYGREGEGLRISGANPGVVAPLTPGTVLVIPVIPADPVDQPHEGGATSPSEVAILIDDKRFRFWENVRIIRAMDTVDVVEFTAPFSHESPEQREAFRPFTYKDAKVTVGGELLFSGTVLGPMIEMGPDATVVHVSAYSKPGVLGDCTLPAGVFPQNEMINQTLEDIATSVAGHFGIGVVFEAPAGAAFEPAVACDTDKRALVFLATLAKQRNLVIGSNEKGELVFRQSAPAGQPVAILEQGQSPLVTVTPSFQPQKYYSHVTGMEPVIIGYRGSKHTIKNPLLADVVRPFNFKVNDAKGGDMQPATQAKMGRMFANMAAYSVTVSTWRDANGDLWTPNTTVQLLAPSAMVYTAYKFTIRGVELARTPQGETATLDLIIPGSFAGEIPDSLPWDD